MRRSRLRANHVFSGVAAFLVAFSVRSASGQYAWVGNCGGTDWYQACTVDDACGPDNDGCLNNWFASHGCGGACPLPFPGAGDAVVISTGVGVSLNGNASVGSLDCQRVFTLNGTLTVNGPASFSFPVFWDGGGMLGAGVTTCTNTLTIGGANTRTLQQRILRNEATTVWSGSGTLDLSNGAEFNNLSSFAIEGDAVMTFSFGNPATFSNNGSIVKQNTAGETLIQGVIFNNAGDVAVNRGTLRLATTGTSTGSFTLVFPWALELNNPYTFGPGASVAGDGVLRINGATVTLASDLDAEGTTHLTSGALIGPGSFAGNVVVWQGVSMTGPGAMVVHDLFINGSAVKTSNGRTITSQGTRWRDDGTIDLINGATFNNTLFMSVEGNGTLTHSTGAASTFNNEGSFTKQTNPGTTLVQDVFFNNPGEVSVQVGTLRLATAGVTDGKFTLAASTAVDMSSGNHTFLPGALVEGAGVLKLSGATLTISGDSTASNVALSAGTLTGGKKLTCSNSLSWTGGTMSGTGTTHNAGLATISGAGLKAISGRNFTNETVTDWTGTGSVDLANGASFENVGTFEAKSDATMTHSAGAIAVFNNSNTGIFRKSGSTGVTLIQDVVFNNLGTVDVQTGTLRLATTGGSSGMFTVAQDATFELGSGSHSFGVGSAVTGSGTMKLSGATISVPADMSAWNVTISAGNVTGSGTLRTKDKLIWTGGKMSGGGGLMPIGQTRIEPTAIATISGGFLKSLQSRTLLNEGVLTWIDAGNLDLSDGAIITNAGTFEVHNDALLNYSFGAAVAFNNAGTFKKLNSSGQTQFVGVPFNNSGQVELETGTLRVLAPYAQGGGSTTIATGAALSSTQPLAFQSGELSGNGTVTGNAQSSGATVRPGTVAGALTISGNYTQSGTGALEIELGGLQPGTEHDRLSVSGTAALGGTLDIRLIDGFTPNVGDRFTVLTCASRSGQFANVKQPASAKFKVEYNAANVTLVAIGVTSTGNATFRALAP